jgi:hypothetical protein
MMSGRLLSISFTPAAKTNSDHPDNPVDTVFANRRPVRRLGRETHRTAFAKAKPVAQQAAQLVLGRDDGDLRACFLERREDRRRAQEFRIVHHHLLAGVRVEEVVAGNPVHRRRPAGDDGKIVGVGKAGHNAVGAQVAALRRNVRQIRRHAGLHRLFDVGRLRAVDADHHGRRFRPGITPAVDLDLCSCPYHSALIPLFSPAVRRYHRLNTITNR